MSARSCTLAAVALLSLVGTARGQNYVPFLIHSAPGRSHDSSVAMGIDNDGNVVGYSYNSLFGTGSPRIAIVYHDGMSAAGGTLADCFPSGGSGYYAISPGGVAVGAASAECSGSSRAVVSSASDPSFQAVYAPLPGGGDCGAADANDFGMVAGWSNQTVGCEPPLCTINSAVPVRWVNGAAQMLPLGFYQVALGTGINAAGDVCGYAFTADPLSYDRVKPVVWPSGALSPTTLPTLGGSFGLANKISEDGTVVGWSELSFGARHATKWVGGTAVDLGTVGGHSYSFASDISAAGIVGYSSVNTLTLGVATLFTPGGAINLNTRLVSPGGIQVISAEAINDNGWIVCNGTYAGVSRGVLLVPCEQAVFIRQYTTQTCLGGTIEFEADAPGGNAPRWFKDGQPLQDGLQPSGALIFGTHDFLLNISNATPADVGGYTCQVSNGCGVATSKPASFKVCLADRNCDGVVDLLDFFVFFNAWDTQSPGADVTGDGEIDLLDFFAFFNAFDVFC